jgi:hypothetical protein
LGETIPPCACSFQLQAGPAEIIDRYPDRNTVESAYIDANTTGD